MHPAHATGMEDRMRRLLCVLALLGIMLVPAGVVSAEAAHPATVRATLQPVDGSGITGTVFLRQLGEDGTFILVHASGLRPGGTYVSLYYDNSTCELEPYSAEDVI